MYNFFHHPKSSVIRTLSGGFLLVLVPVMILCSAFGYWGMNNMHSEVEHSYRSSTQLIAQEFGSELMRLQTMAATVLIDDEAVRLSNAAGDTSSLYEFACFGSRLRLQFVSEYLNADAAVIFPAQKRVVSSKRGVEHASAYSLEKMKKYGPPFSSWAIRLSLRDPSTECLSILIGYVREGQSRPIVLIEIDEKSLIGHLSDLFQNDKQKQAPFFIDPSGKSICLDKSGFLDSSVMEAAARQYQVSGRVDAFTCSVKKAKVRVVPSIMPNVNCIVGVAFSEEEALMPIIRMLWMLYAVLTFSVFAGASYLLLANRKVYTPVHILIDSMQKVAVGDFSIRAVISEKGEFRMMAEQFNHMVEQLDLLLKEKYLSEVKLKKAQLRFLQSQINPHFLYNCLFGVYNMIKSGELDTASNMTIYLAQYYQLGAHLEERNIPIGQELQHIQLYMNILKLRRPGWLDFTYTVEEGLNGLEIPSLSLQTIVENAITHAFNGTQKKCGLRIAIFRHREKIVFRVEDNGSGISETDLKKIRARMYDSSDGGDIHGLKSVFDRMRLMFGEQVDMQVTPLAPHGTRVEVHIPERRADG